LLNAIPVKYEAATNSERGCSFIFNWYKYELLRFPASDCPLNPPILGDFEPLVAPPELGGKQGGFMFKKKNL